MKKIFIGFVSLANFITALGVFFALAAVWCAFEGYDLKYSMMFIVACGVCDCFDGYVARKFKRSPEEKEFGIQFDTVADVICSVVAPPLIVFAVSGNDNQFYSLAVYVLYIISGITRLAFFNITTKSDKPVTHFVGMPVTSITMGLPFIMLFNSHIARVGLLALCTVLFVLNVKIKKPKGIWYVIFSVLFLALIIAWLVKS